MRHGDISNDLPQRILVVSDTFLEVEVQVKRRLKVFPVPKVNRVIKQELLSFLYIYTNKSGTTLELISYNMDEETLSKTVDHLDTLGTNPFRYFSSYDSIEHLVAELPYRPEVLGVLDLPKNLLRYGHWGLDFNLL